MNATRTILSVSVLLWAACSPPDTKKAKVDDGGTPDADVSEGDANDISQPEDLFVPDVDCKTAADCLELIRGEVPICQVVDCVAGECGVRNKGHWPATAGPPTARPRTRVRYGFWARGARDAGRCQCSTRILCQGLCLGGPGNGPRSQAPP